MNERNRVLASQDHTKTEVAQLTDSQRTAIKESLQAQISKNAVKLE